MASESTSAVWIVSIILVTLIVIGLRFHLRFLARLKFAFANEWVALGSPKLVNPDCSKQENSLFLFVLSGRFRRLNDPTLTASGNALQTCFGLSIVCIFLLFISLRNG